MKHVTSGPGDLTVAIGDTVEVRLRESMARDSCWSTSRIGEGLVLRDIRFLPSRYPLPGGTGERIFCFKAKQPGSWPLSLRMRRREDLCADRAQMTITVA